MIRRALATFALWNAIPTLADPGATAVFDYLAYQGADASDADYPVRAGTYRNPVLPGFHPDPSIVRVGRDYYLVNSSFSYFPGLPVFHSRDLVSWTQIGNAVDHADTFDFTGLGIARGLFAPTLRYRAGTFFIVNACVDCGGNFIISATNPAGPWSRPRFLPTIDGIDTDLFFDDDNRAWIANNGPPVGTPRYDGHRAIWIQELDLRTLTMTGPRTVLVDGGVHPEDKPIWAEGPHIIKHDGWYYLIAAEGGTAGNHSQTVYRSRAVTGPYAPGPANPILTQRDLDPARAFPVQATGHADFVQTPAGAWWSVFLGTRPYRDNLSNLGRETFLLPVTWPKGDWPLILPANTPVPLIGRRPTSTITHPVNRAQWRDDFDASALSREWLVLRTPKARWFRTSSVGLTLTAQADSLGGLGNPSFLARRQEHGHTLLETRLHYTPSREGDRAGIAIFADEQHFYTVGLARIDGATRLIVARRNGRNEPQDGIVITSVAAGKPGPQRLRVRIADGAISFDAAFGENSFTPLLENADGSILASEPTNLFTGTVVGLFAQRGR